MAVSLSYNELHQVVICHKCQTCLIPTASARERHLRTKPHRLLGDTLKATLQLLSRRQLKTIDELRCARPAAEDHCMQIEGLKVFDGYHCLEPSCAYATQYLPAIKRHVSSVHQKPAKEHRTTPLWEQCTLQTYFIGKGRIDYFVVVPSNGQGHRKEGTQGSQNIAQSSEAERACFAELERDYKGAKQDLKNQASIVEDLETSRAERVPWLERTGFPSHLQGMKDSEILSSYMLPSKKELDGEANDAEDPDLIRILAAAEAVLQDAYRLCSNTSMEQKMTQQRANILNEFYAGASGRSDGFRYFKNASTLVKYFTTMKQLLVYCYRVVFFETGHFTRSKPEQVLPADIIQESGLQTRAARRIMEALAMIDATDHNDANAAKTSYAALKSAVRQFYVSLICHDVGSTPFLSPVLSFCAMLSRKVHGKGQGLWHDAGNFNSHLSALTWCAQLVIFDYACFQEANNDSLIPILLAKLCKRYFQQLAETPFGYILQWRLYLFKVAKKTIAKHQARWSLDGQTVSYRGVDLKMTQISDLVRSEFCEAERLLRNELMFQTRDLVPMESWRLQDDLDLEDFGGSWLSHPRNDALLKDSDLALFREIQGNTKLCTMFLTTAEGGGGVVLCPHAMAIYESQAQDFLKCVLVLCHVSGGPPLREPELLSVMWRNKARRRHLMIWEKLVMIHTQYHKGQQQSGVYKNNIRFLPKAIGDLLLSYITYVLPLRQLFLRQQVPGALISPYLWSKADGTVWADGAVSACLRKACIRAEVPRLHTSNWRQLAASITKEKFSRKERAYFDVEGENGIADDLIDDEQDLVALAEQSNHSYVTFNHAYAGTTTMTMSVLLHRNYRASESWRALFRFDHILLGKRPRSGSDALSLQMLDSVKRGQWRKRGTYSEKELLAVAQRLHNEPDLKFRRAGQRDGILAVLGPQSEEQVVLVMGTGSGKTLVVMLCAAMANAGITILIIPMVALRVDMLRRFCEVGIQPLIWSIGCTKSAPLVLVSAEAACTQGFLEYCQLQVRKQELSRIVVDESHLTIKAGSYRRCMAQLGWYVRQVRTQTVWLTATLPPVMEEEFIESNKLIKPHIVRASTNRSNLKYNVHYHKGRESLAELAVKMIEQFRHRAELFDQSRDKIIVYCRTRKEVAMLAKLFQCSSFTSASGSEAEKATILSDWVSNQNQPVIVATSALGVGFDYPHVRWVIHLDAPSEMTAFSQESGRAGRDGKKAASIVLLPCTWAPQASTSLTPDQAAMQLYLTRMHCSRGVLSQFLDGPQQWTWCMASDELCQACVKPHANGRPHNVMLGSSGTERIPFTGPEEVRRQDHRQDQALDSYEKDLRCLMRLCLYCRILGRHFKHSPGECSQRFEWIHAKKVACRVQKDNGKGWMPLYIVCWKCYQPQSICRVADPEHSESTCHFPDMVIPLCYGVYKRVGGPEWVAKHFKRTFTTELEYMLWLGEVSSLSGNECIQATRIAALAMADLG